VGGGDADPRSKKVTILHSSAIVKAVAEGTVEWEPDHDFGYEVASSLPGIDDLEILQPRRLYEREGRLDEYQRVVEQLRLDRRAYLHKWEGLDPTIVDAAG
jgi:phosphoenolpyruvate carboxykinase (ATP)